ncbi:hypothetical protein F5146DRAFT_263002 [Armillaria mellea]|nr:hypothetical protein F5146DRAFT_263002 [Armillaria mellea]
MEFIESDWETCPGCSCPNHAPTRYLDSIYPLPVTHNVDLSRLQSTNAVPLPCEVDAVNGAILVAEQQLKQIQQQTTQLAHSRDALMGQVTRINAQIVALTQRCEETKARIKASRKVLSVVRRLPMEILQEIFLATVDFPPRMSWSSAGQMWSVDSSTPIISLWDIELVSKGWRSALLSCARAWSYIVIRDASLFDLGYSEVIRLGRQLRRAQNHPLSIFIHEPQRRRIRTSHLIVCLIPFADKIHTMHLSVSYNTFPHFCPVGSSLSFYHPFTPYQSPPTMPLRILI